MKYIAFILFTLISVQANSADPCTVVKPGMTRAEVRKLAGDPANVRYLGLDHRADGGADSLVIWNYRTQAVQISGDKVLDVIADTKKYGEWLREYTSKKITREELKAKIANSLTEDCK